MASRVVAESVSETFQVTGYRCLRCTHEWVRRPLTDERPRQCPRCKSASWDLVKASAEVDVTK